MTSRYTLMFLVLALSTVGCVERRFVVTTEPMGAQVFVNGEPLTGSPADSSFIYYGDYEFTLVADGYETVRVVKEIERPWYQYPVIDFFAENVIPYRFRDVHHLHFPMVPLQKAAPDQVLRRGLQLRQIGQSIPDPTPKPTGPAPEALPAPGQPAPPPTVGRPGELFLPGG